MSLGSNLYKARKKVGLSQEEVAEKISISRQTISKWEVDDTIPNIYQVRELAGLYQISLAELVECDEVMMNIKKVMDKTSDNNVEQVNWTKVWSKKYPVLETYKANVDISFYASQIRFLLQSLETDYQYTKLDAMLVLKDILAQEWKS